VSLCHCITVTVSLSLSLCSCPSVLLCRYPLCDTTHSCCVLPPVLVLHIRSPLCLLWPCYPLMQLIMVPGLAIISPAIVSLCCCVVV